MNEDLDLVGGQLLRLLQAVAAARAVVVVRRCRGRLAERHLRLQGSDAVLVLDNHRLQLADLVGELLQRLILQQNNM